MVSKSQFSYQWRLFVPLVLCFWASIYGMYRWQNERVRIIRHEMVYDQMRVAAALINYRYSSGQSPESTMNFMREFYRASEHYDPMSVRVVDISSGEPIIEVGDRFENNDFPSDSLGVFTKERVLTNGTVNSRKYIYYTTVTPDNENKIYITLPYTRSLRNESSTRNITFWLIFTAIGLFITMLVGITTNYLGRNIKILKRFAHEAANGKNIDEKDFDDFPDDELGDISRQILMLYNSNKEAARKRDHEHMVALNAIEEKNRLKCELTGNINHELKTPVGIVRGYIDTMCDNPDMDPEVRERFLHKAKDGIQRLTLLIQDITSITKLESGGKLVNVVEIDFHDFVFSFANNIEESGLLQGKMRFEMDIPLNVKVMANESLLNSVILNLVKNAVLYSGGTEIHLSYVKEDDEFYYFRFYDNGVGVAPEHLTHIFERFYRVDSGRSRSAGGTGLGLAIVQITIQSFGGEISVTNHFPTGLEFNFSLQKYSAFMAKKKAEKAKAENAEDDHPSAT